MTFELKLFKYFKAYFIVYTALLKSASDNARFMKIMNVEKYENQNYVIKKAYFISFHEKMRAEKMIYLFKQHIIANHRVSTEMIFDKNM